MRSYDVTEAQVRLNECGEGEYVHREVVEHLRHALENIKCLAPPGTVLREDAEAALNFADSN